MTPSYLAKHILSCVQNLLKIRKTIFLSRLLSPVGRLKNRNKMQLRDKKIAILVASGVEDLEFYVPFMRLQEEGAEVIAAGAEIKSYHGKHGLEIEPTATFYSLRSEDLFALVIPGGWAPDKLRRSEDVKRLVNGMDARGKIIDHLSRGTGSHFGRYRSRAESDGFPRDQR